jgi:hypothetical protein
MIKLAYLDSGHRANVLLLLLLLLETGRRSSTTELFSDADAVLVVACGFALLVLAGGLILDAWLAIFATRTIGT